MDGGFSYGSPARLRPKLGRGPRKRTGVDARLIYGAVALLVAGAAAFALLSFLGDSGSEVGAANEQAVGEGVAASDEQARAAARAAVVAAAGVAAGGPYSGVTVEQLQAFDPALSFTEGPSTGPAVVSVAATDEAFGAAVLSDSGTCFFHRGSISGGSDDGALPGTCTGAAALGA
jgi:hypothetical protein